MTELFNKKVTIYNDIPATLTEARHFDKFTISKCNIQGGYIDKANGTIANIVNAQTVITKDIAHYKSSADYAQLPADKRTSFFTAQIGDFIVFDEIDDIVTSAAEFSQLQNKYKNNGIKIMSISENIYGLDVDNIAMTNV